MPYTDRIRKLQELQQAHEEGKELIPGADLETEESECNTLLGGSLAKPEEVDEDEDEDEEDKLRKEKGYGSFNNIINR